MANHILSCRPPGRKLFNGFVNRIRVKSSARNNPAVARAHHQQHGGDAVSKMPFMRVTAGGHAALSTALIRGIVFSSRF